MFLRMRTATNASFHIILQMCKYVRLCVASALCAQINFFFRCRTCSYYSAGLALEFYLTLLMPPDVDRDQTQAGCERSKNKLKEKTTTTTNKRVDMSYAVS